MSLVTLTIWSQQAQPYVDFTKAKAAIEILPSDKKVKGTVTFQATLLQNVDSLYIDAQRMHIEEVLLNAKKVQIRYDQSKLWILKKFKKGREITITVPFIAMPQKALYFVKDEEGKDQIWTQGQGKDTSNWLPSFDDMNEKLEFDLSITYPKGAAVIANGKLLKKEMNDNHKVTWHYDMNQPMSSYLVAMAIGNYTSKSDISKNGTPLQWYYYPKDEDKFESTYAHSKEIFDYLEAEIGIPFPWQNYKQIPVKDFLYAGMENTGTTIFSDAFVVDEIGYKDRNYINVNAHELAHQWFGDLVTETESKHHWLQEGFATYYALLAERKIFGKNYFYYKLYESAEQLIELSRQKKATALLNPKASSLTFYQKGAWALYALEQKIGGEHFRKTIQAYLETYRFKNVTTDNFIHTAEKISGQKLTTYYQTWLTQVDFPAEEALELLKKSNFIKEYLAIAKERTQPLIGKWQTLEKGLKFPVNDYIGQEVVYQLQGDTSQEALALYKKALASKNTAVLQAVANTMTKIPTTLQKQYEAMLKSESYAVIEPALYQLWANFPSKRQEYLSQTAKYIGFNDKNVRILWLVLAINTSEYTEDQKRTWFEELTGYTGSRYGFNARQNAFGYIENLEAFTDAALQNLIAGAQHHNWRFKKFCNGMVDRLLTKEGYQKRFLAMLQTLSSKEQSYIKKKLKI